jgi:hypothetical protein
LPEPSQRPIFLKYPSPADLYESRKVTLPIPCGYNPQAPSAIRPTKAVASLASWGLLVRKWENGGDDRLAKQTLYQLSYIPTRKKQEVRLGETLA